MTIYVDADAFPRSLRDILLRASKRLTIPVTFVANRYIRLPDSDLLTCIVAAEGPDQADARIAELATEGDLVITADVPLADRVVESGATALDPHGTLYTEDNIKELRKTAIREGLEGISPRYIQDKISNALVRDADATCINPFMVSL